MSDSSQVGCAWHDCDESFVKNVHNQKYCSDECKRDANNARKRKELTEDLARALAPSYLSNEDIDDDQVEYLRKENRRLTNLVTKHKSHKSEAVEATYRAVYEAMSKMDIKPVSPPGNLNRSKYEEVANPALSDFQIGKVSSSYNVDVCEERIQLYAEKVIRITDIQRSDHPVNRVHVHALGDIVEGEDIFPGQAFQIDVSLYEQMVRGVEIVSDFIRRMLSNFEEVHFVGVIGNHGLISSRNRANYNPETNMDRLLYKFVSMLFADEPRITFNIPEGYGESNFYAIDKIGNHKVLMMHGDQFPVPTSGHGYRTKVLGWKDSGIHEDFDSVIVGHYHQNTKMTIGSSILRIAGSPESDNTYASERLATMGRPSQHLQYISPTRGITAEYDVYLDQE